MANVPSIARNTIQFANLYFVYIISYLPIQPDILPLHQTFHYTEIEQPLMEKWELTSSDVDQECDDDYLLKFSLNLVNWELVGRHLELTDPDINSIKHNVTLDTVLKCYHALKKWRSKNLITGTATYRLLLRKLLESECNHELALEVCRLLKEGESDN